MRAVQISTYLRQFELVKQVWLSVLSQTMVLAEQLFNNLREYKARANDIRDWKRLP